MINSICLTLFLCIACGQTQSVRPLSDRELDGFVGPVKKAFVEWSPLDAPRGYIPVGSRCRDSTKIFNEAGRLIEQSFYPGTCGRDEIREKYMYGADGSRTKDVEEIRGKDSPPPPPPMRRDSNQETGKSRTIFKYDSAGKLVEEASIRPSGKVIFKHVFRYDTEARLLEMIGYDDEGRVSVRRVYGYAGDNRVPSQFAYYGSDGKVYERTTYTAYEFNSRGDWIKRKEQLKKP